MKYISIILIMGLFGFFSKKDKSKQKIEIKQEQVSIEQQFDSVSYEEQIKTFKSLGYDFTDGVSKEMILTDGYAKPVSDEIKKERLQEIEQNPFSRLYYYYGWRSPEIPNYNFSERCIWFDLEFFDPNIQYKWFMERMGAITNGEIEFTEIKIDTDSENWEWISFKVNGIPKKWKLEKTGYIADHFVQRFSYLPNELATKGKFTYYDDGGQQWVIDYATEEEQIQFNKKTGLKREWLGEGNHFAEPPKE